MPSSEGGERTAWVAALVLLAADPQCPYITYESTNRVSVNTAACSQKELCKHLVRAVDSAALHGRPGAVKEDMKWENLRKWLKKWAVFMDGEGEKGL